MTLNQNNMEKTAVEWLEMQIGSKIADAKINISAAKFFELINQAKEMEKAQHEKTWNMGNEVPQMKSFNQYFTETFIRNLH